MKIPILKYGLAAALLAAATAGHQGAYAQWYNDGLSRNAGGLISDWTTQGWNAAGGDYATTGSTGAPDMFGVFEHRGPSGGTSAGATMRNDGTYDAAVFGRDYFLGPDGMAGQQSIGGTTAPIFGEIFFQNGASNFDILNDNGITVDDLAAFENAITTTERPDSSVGAIRFRDGAAYANTNLGDAQYVNGYVSKIGNDGFVFPVGDQGGTDYRPLSISGPSVATDHLSVAYWQGDPSTGLDPSGGAHPTTSLNTTPLNGEVLLSVSPLGFWDFVPVSGTSNFSITASLPNNNVLGGYTNAAGIRLVGWNNALGQWELLGNTPATGTSEGDAVSGNTGAYSGRSMASYSAIGWGSVNNFALPVSLISFSATLDAACKATLRWQTGSEHSVLRYEVEYSTDARTFIRIGEAAATYPQGGDYAFAYGEVRQGPGYFRLRIVDADGSHTYSEPATVRADCDRGSQIVIAPNPMGAILTVTGLQAGDELRVLSATGQMVRSAKATAGTVSADVRPLAAGIYLVTILRNGEVLKTEKVRKED